jgi:ankyrin repeat protein
LGVKLVTLGEIANQGLGRKILCEERVLGIGLMTGLARAQALGKDREVSAKEVKALIDRLTELDQQDTGYSASVTGSAFLPLGQSETGMVLLFPRKPHASSEALKSLVKLGVKALPTLLEHLSDSRPTKIVLTHGGCIGGMFIEKDEEKGAKKDEFPFGGGAARYTVMVGDLCYVAIGQIVNRNYWAVRYQPTAIILVNSVPQSKKLREEVIKEWKNLTPEKHRDSLVRDLLDSGNEYVRNGASLRLAYYYPAALESAALKQLARPTYSVFEVEDLIRDRLYPAKTAKARKALVDEFVKRNGEIAREGIRWALFEDLDTQEADEEGRLSPKLKHRYRARECLIDVFGLPATVKSKDRPRTEPLAATTQARFIQTLHYDRSEKLDRALRDLLAKTDDDYMAKGCLDRLVGRGYDADIEAYLKRRLPLLKGGEQEQLRAYEAKLGWTRLHAAVDLDVSELIETALEEKVPVDARGRDGRTALHIAAADGKAAAVERLLEAKANPNIKDKKGLLAVQLAAQEGDATIVRLLVAKKSEVPDVFVAATVGATDRLATMVKEKHDVVKLRNNWGETPLHVAAREGHLEAVRTLIKAGADVKALDDPKGKYRYPNGWTPLHLAAMAGKTAVAALLLDHGAEVTAADQRGKFTPLHYAAWAGNADLVTLLLARKADRGAKDEMNRTPLDLAKEKGNTTVIKLLEK